MYKAAFLGLTNMKTKYMIQTFGKIRLSQIIARIIEASIRSFMLVCGSIDIVTTSGEEGFSYGLDEVA